MLVKTLVSSLKPDIREVRGFLLRVVVLLSVLIICSVTAALGLGFLVWALYLYLSTHFEPYTAALLSGGAAVVLSVLLVAAAVYFTGMYKRKRKAAVYAAASPVTDGLDVDGALNIIKQHPLEAGLTAAIAGFLAGSSPDARKNLAEFALLFKSGIQK